MVHLMPLTPQHIISCFIKIRIGLPPRPYGGIEMNVLLLQATIALVASVWVMLHVRVKVHSPTPPQSNTPPGPSQSGTSHWDSWHHAYISLLTVIAHAQPLQSDILHG